MARGPESDAVRAVLARARPDLAAATPRLLGRGLDHAVFEVGDELLIRLPRLADPDRTRLEVARLTTVARLSPLPVPEIVFTDAGSGAIAYRRIIGVPLDRHRVAEPTRLAEPLGRFLSALHGADPGRLRRIAPIDRFPAADQLREAERDYRSVRESVPAAHRPAVEAFLREAPPDETDEVRFCHNDLGAEHLIIDPATDLITGVIDWSDAAITDPARDLGRLRRDLGPDVAELILEHYDRPLDRADRDRIRFQARCTLLEDLAYGLGPGPRRYADAALAHLPAVFG